MAKESHGSSRSKAVLGGKGKSKSKGGKHPHELHIRRGAKGGFISRHSYKPDADTGVSPEDEEHPIADMDSLHDHLDQSMGRPTPHATSYTSTGPCTSGRSSPGLASG